MIGRIKYASFILFFLLNGFVLFSQNRVGKKQIKKMEKEAQLYLDLEDYVGAWQLYKQIIILDPKNEKVAVDAAICLFKLNYSVDSIFIFGTNLSTSKLIDAKYYLAKIKHKQRLFYEALVLLEAYKKVDEKKRLHTDAETDYMINVCNNAKLFVSKPHRSIIKNMGAEINSPYPDYVPVISPDESALYFTSKRDNSTGGKKNGDGSYYEDVYVSYKEKDAWKNAENIGTAINTENNDACVAISPDGQSMIIYRTASDQVTGDLYLTKIGADNKWQKPWLMSSDINSEYTETSACFTSNSDEFYFTSDRPGGFGGKDIYCLKKLPDGRWALPYNLGETINTAYDEDAPFLHPDGVTLYFSSRGHNTMGDYDVFKSVLNKETNQFSKPENLGYPINDVNNDIFFVLSVDGQRGYYSSVKSETFGGSDIYQIDTRFGDNDLVVKHGIITENGQAVHVKIKLMDIENNLEAGVFYSNPNSGKFILVLNPMKPYKAIIEAVDTEKYETIEIPIKPVALDKNAEQTLEFQLKKMNAK